MRRKRELIDEAVTGSSDPVALFAELTHVSLFERAGYVPPKSEYRDAPIIDDKQLYNYEIKRSSDVIARVISTVGSYGVVAGSAAMWSAGYGDSNWFPSDIDVFTFSDDDDNQTFYSEFEPYAGWRQAARLLCETHDLRVSHHTRDSRHNELIRRLWSLLNQRL